MWKYDYGNGPHHQFSIMVVVAPVSLKASSDDYLCSIDRLAQIMQCGLNRHRIIPLPLFATIDGFRCSLAKPIEWPMITLNYTQQSPPCLLDLRLSLWYDSPILDPPKSIVLLNEVWVEQLKPVWSLYDAQFS